jgi:hypothetical protein
MKKTDLKIISSFIRGNISEEELRKSLQKKKKKA